MSADPSINPYQSPQVGNAQHATNDQAATSLPLFSATTICVTTFLASFAAASVLIAINFWRMGRQAAAWWSFALGWLGTVAYVLVIAFIPISDLPSLVFAIPQIVLAYFVVAKFQQPYIDAHLGRGGKLVSSWWAAGIATIAVLAFLACMFSIFFLIPESWFPLEE